MSSKSKKRLVLPSRPEPPTVEQIVEDINRAYPNDPVFTVLQDESQDAKSGSTSSEVEMLYQQSRRFLELNERLQNARADLVRHREEMKAVGDSLTSSVDDVKEKAGSLPCFNPPET